MENSLKYLEQGLSDKRNDTIMTFIFVIILNILITIAGFYTLIITDASYIDLDENFLTSKFTSTISKDQYFVLSTCTVVVLMIFIKITIVAACLSLGGFLLGNTWIFKPFIRVAAKAELILTAPALVKIFWFSAISTNYTLNDLQLFYPLSLLNLFEPGTVEPYWRYPLQVLNLFEVAYWFALAYGVAQIMNASLERGFGLVMASYGSGLALWVVFVMFLTVSLS